MSKKLKSNAEKESAAGLMEGHDADAVAVVEDLAGGNTPGADAFSRTVESTIAEKSIGERIKFLRQRKAMGLVELGRHTGLSASFLSQLETGRVVPTLRNLARIAMVFSRDISYFFEPNEEELFRIVRAEERTRLPQTGADVPGYFFENLGGSPNGHNVTPYVAEFLPADGKRSLREHQHGGAEFLYVLSGCLQITHGERTENFEAGDAVYFHASVKHSYQRIGDEACTAMILTMPTTPAMRTVAARRK